MNISIPCPELIRLNAIAILDALPTVAFKVEGGLLSFNIIGERTIDRLACLTMIQGEIVAAICGAEDPTLIAALGELKAAVAGVEPIVRHESSYISANENDAAEQVAEAIDADAVSHLQGEQHTSNQGSSEQHGAAPQNNEENVNDEAQQKEPVARPSRKQRAGR